jgi:tetratricopeptide (TPR) repeat protein
VRIPEGVREVIGRRLDRLSERCNQTLTIASVIGREFTPEQLKPLIEDMTEDRLLEVLEEALAARVIEELPRAVGRYQFTHALIQETLAEELTLTRRVRLHARIAETLEALYGANAEAHAAELAHHFAEAESVLGTEKLVKYSRLAGERALAAYAWEQALAHFQRALAAKGVQHPADTGVLQYAPPEESIDAETAALLFGLGRAQAATFDRLQFDAAIDTLRRAFDYYVEVGDVERTVAIAEYPLAGPSGVQASAAPLVARALALVSPDSHAAGRLLSRYGFFYGYILGLEQDAYARAQEAFRQALAIARRERDVALEARTLADAAYVDNHQFRRAEGLEKALRAIELARRIDDPRTEVAAQSWAVEALVGTGDLERARQHAAAARPAAERLRDRHWLCRTLHQLEVLARVEGEWEAAREISNRVLAIEPQGPFAATRALLEYELGDFIQGEAYLERLLESMRLIPPGPHLFYAAAAVSIPLVARISGIADRSGVAERAAGAVLAHLTVTPIWRPGPGSGWGCWRCRGAMGHRLVNSTLLWSELEAPCSRLSA